MKSAKPNNYATEEQLLLAKLLKVVVTIGLSLIIVAFALYISGVLPVILSPDEVYSLWHLSSEEYHKATSIPKGWGWFPLLPKGAVLSFSTLALISLGAILCIAILSVAFFKKKNWLYGVIAAIQTGILLLAASGLTSGG